MTKYYMSLDTLVEVDGETESERFQQARKKFKQLLMNDEMIDIVCVDTDDFED